MPEDWWQPYAAPARERGGRSTRLGNRLARAPRAGSSTSSASFAAARLYLAASGVAHALPDLSIALGSFTAESPFKATAAVSNIGTTYPTKYVVVRLELSLFRCSDRKSATAVKYKLIKGSWLKPGATMTVTFGPYLASGGWILSGLMVRGDPFDTIAEGPPGSEDNNSAGIMTFVNCNLELIATLKQAQASDGKLEVFATDGRKVFEAEAVDLRRPLDLSELDRSLPNGIYLYVVTENGRRSEVRKLMITR